MILLYFPLCLSSPHAACNTSSFLHSFCFTSQTLYFLVTVKYSFCTHLQPLLPFPLLLLCCSDGESLRCPSQCCRFIGRDKSSPTVAAVSVHQTCCQSAKQQAALAESINPISVKTNQGPSYIHPPGVNAPSPSCLFQHMLGALYEE